MKNCTVKGCFASQQSGDILFCVECRKNWRAYLVRQGIEWIQVPELDMQQLLNIFQQKPLRIV